MKSVLAYLATCGTVMWVLIHCVMVFTGISDSRYSDCYERPIKRIELLFPGYIVGCYLGRPL